MIRDRKSEITDISIFTFINSIRIMKIKNYLALTLMAAVSFAACDKGENGTDAEKRDPYFVQCRARNPRCR